MSQVERTRQPQTNQADSKKPEQSPSNQNNEKKQVKTMRAAVVRDFGEKVEVHQIPIPKPKPGQVLVKMEAAPINPSDLAYVAGKYGIKNDPPFKVGLEGSGKVVENGGGLYGWYLLGKRVACISTASSVGSWAEYMVTMAPQVIPLPDKYSYEQGASFFVNPMTAVAFRSFVKEGNHKAAIINAACSSVGKMFSRIMKEEKIPLIHIVRKDEQVQELKEMGVNHILNSSDPNYQKDLKALAAKLKATIFFDAVGGEEMWQIVKNMPMNSQIHLYGHLSNRKTDHVDPSHLIFTNKQIKGYYLAFWVRQFGLMGRIQVTKYLYDNLDKTLKTDIVKSYPLERANEAIKFYQENMSMGKVIIKPSL